jgi:hypothetical protein
MSEGEFKKRISDLFKDLLDPTAQEIDEADLFGIIDEAKKEFFETMHFTDLEHIKEFIRAHENEKEGFIEDVVTALKWFVKWFGEQNPKTMSEEHGYGTSL